MTTLDELADPDLAGVLQCLLDDDIALVGHIAVGKKIVRRLVIAHVDVVLVDKTDELDGVGEV